MKELIHKDVCVILQTVKRLLILIPIIQIFLLVIIAFESKTDSGIYMLPVITYMAMFFVFPFATYVQDEKNGWFRQGFVMPISHLNYYHAKILLNLICTGCAGLISIVISVISALIFGDCTPKVIGLIFAAAGVMLLISVIINICSNALIIRLGVQKAAKVIWGNILIVNLPTISGLLIPLLHDPKKEIITIIIRVSILLGIIVLGVTVLLYILGREWIQNLEE
ncbi:MAG: hypothetical protein E7504_02040 [Ruminococcus sp.]|nr:hypothetical protein [Ruminococcus sp.]